MDVDKKWLIIVSLIVIVVGTLLHYVYHWSNENRMVGYLSPVNESVWEHLKLIVFPLMLAVAIEIIYLSRTNRSVNNPWTALFLSIAAGMVFIVVTFYTYTGAFTKESKVVVDIGTFIVAAILSSFILHYLFRLAKFDKQTEMIALAGLVATLLMVFYFTYHPPAVPLFEESLAN